MTGFSSISGALGRTSWVWEIRSVNGRGLDLRLRLPDSIDGLEILVRKRLSETLSRGNLSVNLRLSQGEGDAGFRVDETAMIAVLKALDQVQERAFEMGVTLAQPTAADVLSQRGVLVMAAEQEEPEALKAAVLADFETALAAFVEMRAAEGKQLASVILGQLSQIETCVQAASDELAARSAEHIAALRKSLASVREALGDVDETRVAQEIALLAVKADVTEELDRLRAHINAARDLVASNAASGRKLDFLAQEFNREANTLCSKSQAKGLTAIGLDLKAVIDQMREQIQNVE
ncbi:YicC/YloC family endoribonuclease [Marivivens sp. LCG002]|uniref:YicC/YloC family endoribonuclease n=1 Tax=Marivivens sp. LCG002 TaxID=3051171 RepID=UPI0025565AA7|nr:YicC/YloC family endoribonuclease [Marivivens sp. LCG002]WIV52110.1 YicC/YloC family endoribonuclease [Marivivens sp. LCG002]